MPVRLLKPRRGSPCGFTLIELLVVISVIAILMALLVPTLNAIRTQISITKCTAMIEGIGMALENYKQAYFAYPPDQDTVLTKSAECLVYFLSGAPSPRPSFYQFKSDSLAGSTPGVVDPWRHRLVYFQTGVHNRKTFDLFSAGPDGTYWTSDDVRNWRDTSSTTEPARSVSEY